MCAQSAGSLADMEKICLSGRSGLFWEDKIGVCWRGINFDRRHLYPVLTLTDASSKYCVQLSQSYSSREWLYHINVTWSIQWCRCDRYRRGCICKMAAIAFDPSRKDGLENLRGQTCFQFMRNTWMFSIANRYLHVAIALTF
jgi:hypothetical protein